MKIAIVTQARVGSIRLPEKVLKKIGDCTLLEIHLRNASNIAIISEYIVATTDETNAFLIEDEAQKLRWKCYKGSVSDVLSRFYFATEKLNVDFVIRITSDCPFVQPEIITNIIKYAIDYNLDYASTSENFPDGVDVEVFTMKMLKSAFENAQLLSEREHVTPWIRENAKNKGLLEPSIDYYKDVRLTVDEMYDFECIETLMLHLGPSANWIDYSKFILDNPNLFKNQKIKRNEGYLKSLLNDKK
jgi:spore coat polysaccharide biosynthesis protein SpsF